MSQGRGSAIPAIAVMVLTLVYLLSQTERADAATYSVGDAAGWTFKVAKWPKGKSFKAGDLLVFKYSKGAHNVVAVNKGGYRTCKAPAGSKVFQSGKDQIKLVKGANYFICSFAGHCEGGMKIAVNAA